MNATKRFIKGEFIGRQISVIDHTDPTLKGLQGIIVDETKHTLTLETEGVTKIIPKPTATLDIDGQRVEGKKIAYRPEDRIRKIK